MQHLVDTNDFSEKQLSNIMYDAKTFKKQMPSQLLRDKLLITLFFESSTRTRSSFEVAAKRLGASIVHLDPSKSSTTKGESLEDTFANLCAMEPDGVIIRHEYNNTAQKLANKELTTVINAGAGNYAHPTQALLDYFTMLEHFKSDNLQGKTIAIVGDIVSSRVASSGIRLFTRMGMNVVLVAPKPFMPNNDLPKYEHLDEVIDKVDIVMSLRAQLERHKAPIFEDYEEYAKEYCITKERVGKGNILLLHPGPVMRNIDISDEMLNDERCKVLTQVKNGVFVRMAILKALLLDS
jgi:aspartate carbamoyltransferase catalytic subunit